MLDQVLHILV